MKRVLTFFLLFFFAMAFSFSGRIHAQDLKLQIKEAPASGIILCPLKKETLAFLYGKPAEQIQEVAVFYGETSIPAQYAGGNLVFQLNETLTVKSQSEILNLTLKPAESAAAAEQNPEKQSEIHTRCAEVECLQKSGEKGGFPQQFVFPKTGKVLEKIQFFDRLHDSDKESPFAGGWRLADDSAAEVEIVSDGPVCRLVRQRVRFVRETVRPEGEPAAVYDWYFFKNADGLVYLEAHLTQNPIHAWSEQHLMELHLKDETFNRMVGQNRNEKVELRIEKTDKILHVQNVGAFTDGKNYVTFFGMVGAYDGKRYGPYLHADVQMAWAGWDSSEEKQSAWMMFNSFETEEEFWNCAERHLKGLRPRFVKLAAPALWETAQSEGEQNLSLREPWRAGLAESLLFGSADYPKEKIQKILNGPLNVNLGGSWNANAVGEMDTDTPFALLSGDLVLLCEKTGTPEMGYSVHLLGLADRKSGQVFTNGMPQSLFGLDVRSVESKKVTKLTSVTPWREISVVPQDARPGFSITFRAPIVKGSPELEPLEWTLNIYAAQAESQNAAQLESQNAAQGNGNGIRMSWSGKTNSEKLSLMEVSAGEITCGNVRPHLCAYYPQTTGILIRKPFQETRKMENAYPTGWCVMPWMAIWDEEEGLGLYVSQEDPFGSLKNVCFSASPEERTLKMGFRHPLPNQTVPGNEAKASGEFVLKSFRGDWFDAAVLYRMWVRENAVWFPKLGEEGRMDTPQWMKELCVWSQDGGDAPQMVQKMRDFRDGFGVPCAVHWYNWHKNPFDNDYPHYVPRDGFRDAVVEIQKDGDIFVMPYINGRLWDTRDRGIEDFQFTSTALPAAAKDENGEPRVETYKSKESDGSLVKLGCMCPSTQLWKDKVREVISGLMNEQCVKGVYVDQVAAAVPAKCMDPSHGHPLGGGSWWVAEYDKMLQQIWNDIGTNGNEFSRPEERILTTECNAEPYLNRFDGYLTWHLQSDQAVPGFAAVYGGAIQMFGRNYGGDGTAIRMKAAQQLIFGEQIGWFYAGIVKNEEHMKYLRPLVHFRKQVVPYFFKGEMARPPRLLGEIPEVTGDWQWHGKTPVTMKVVQTSAWRLLEYPKTENREWSQGNVQKLLLIFTNFSEESVSARMETALEESGFGDLSKVRIEKVTSDGTRTKLSPEFLESEISFPPLETWGIEITRESP